MRSSSPDHANTVPGLARQVTAATGGAVVYALLFGWCGAMSGHAAAGVVGGAAVGAVVGYGLVNGLFGLLVVWASWVCVSTLIMALLGPACDADPVESALVGTILGALVGFADWRWLVLPVGALAWATVGLCTEGIDDAMRLALICGTYLGWFILAYVVFVVFAADEQ